MRKINKKTEPASLKTHRASQFSNYDNYQDKQTLREYLCDEQRGICCYCMGTILSDEAHMKIEHFKCQDNYPQHQLDYWNLMGACPGGKGQPPEKQHCDTSKANKKLSYNPSSKLFLIENSIWYKKDGLMGSSNHVLDKEINEILHLNIDSLKNKRKGALNGFMDFLRIKYKSQLKKSTLEKWLHEWNGESNNGRLSPYCQIVVFYIQLKLKINKANVPK